MTSHSCPQASYLTACLPEHIQFPMYTFLVSQVPCMGKLLFVLLLFRGLSVLYYYSGKSYSKKYLIVENVIKYPCLIIHYYNIIHVIKYVSNSESHLITCHYFNYVTNKLFLLNCLVVLTNVSSFNFIFFSFFMVSNGTQCTHCITWSPHYGVWTSL